MLYEILETVRGLTRPLSTDLSGVVATQPWEGEFLKRALRNHLFSSWLSSRYFRKSGVAPDDETFQRALKLPLAQWSMGQAREERIEPEPGPA
jgi:hypothetical protein